MKVFRKWILLVSGAVAVLGGCALPGLDGSNFAVPSGAELTLAKQYEQRGEPELARQVYQGLIEAAPEQAAPHHRLGILAAKQGDFASADRHFRHAHALEPANIDLLNDAGYAYYLQGRLAEAEDFLKLALAHDPHNSRAQNNLGLVLGRQGRLEESLAMFRRVVPEAEARANLAHVSVASSDGPSTSGLYRSTAPLQDDGFGPVLASRLARQRVPRIEQGASLAGTSRIEASLPLPIEAGAVAPAGHHVPQAARRIGGAPTPAPEPSSRVAGGSARAEPRRTEVSAVRTPRLFERPRRPHGDWAVEGSVKSAGTSGAPLGSAAERAGERLQRKSSPPEATLSAAVQSARRTASRSDVRARVRTPRLFGAPAARPGHVDRMQGLAPPTGAEGVRTGRPTGNTAEGRPAATSLQSRPSDSGPEIVYLNRSSAKESAEAPRSKILFGPPPSSTKQSKPSDTVPEIVYLNRNSAQPQKQTPRVKVLFGPETRGE